MSDCNHYFHQVERLQHHKLDDESQRQLFAHLAECENCRGLFDVQNDLATAGNGYGEPAPGDLSAMRGRVMDEIRQTAMTPTRSSGAADRPIMLRWGRAALAAAAVLLLVVGGYIGGRQSRTEPSASPVSWFDSVENVALQNHTLSDVEESTSIFSDVKLREVGGDRVLLAFDVSRHIELVRPQDDPLVREVMVHALLNPSSLDARLKAIRYARGVMEPKVRQALVFAMLNDSSLPVRLRAMDTLSEDPLDQQTEEALLQVLVADSSEQMRLKAIDLLATATSSVDDFRRTVTSSGALEDPVVAARINQLTDL